MPKTIKKYIQVAIFLFGLCFEFTTIAQNKDSLQIEFQSGIIVANDNFNPFYLTHNRWGTVSFDQNVFFQAEAGFSKSFSENWMIKGNAGIRNEFLYSAHLDVVWKGFNLYFGNKGRTLGGIEDNELSTGSLALGNNSLPIPQVGLELDYFALPMSHGYVMLKGGMSHGWFEKDRYVSKALLHQKYAKIVIDLDDLVGIKIYSSLIHFAQYGGITSSGDRQPSSLNDFKRVFFGQGIPNPLGGTRGESNAVGNHLGLTEWTWDQRIGKFRLQINYQKPFEDQGSMQYLSFKDFLVGVRLVFPESSKISTIYFEWIRSVSQSGPGLPDGTDEYQSREDNFGYEIGGRDDYYNNWLYQSGWTYKNKILSNPLFLTYEWSLNFLPTFSNYSNQVINNRIKAYHLGMILEPSEKLSLKGMFTYSINYGTYAGLYEGRFAWEGIKTDPAFDYAFLGGKRQFYSLIEAAYQSTLLKQPINLKGMFAFDSGVMYQNYGIELAIEFILRSY